MSEQIHQQQHSDDDIPVEELHAKDVRDPDLAQDTDDLLDEIDDVLEENAQAFVEAFVQKGGE